MLPFSLYPLEVSSSSSVSPFMIDATTNTTDAPADPLATALDDEGKSLTEVAYASLLICVVPVVFSSASAHDSLNDRGDSSVPPHSDHSSLHHLELDPECRRQMMVHKFSQALESIDDQQIYLFATEISIIKSDQKIRMLSPHLDFETLLGYETQPLICLFALEDQVEIMIEGKLIRIPRGTLLILQGNMPHKGISGDVPPAGEKARTIIPVLAATIPVNATLVAARLPPSSIESNSDESFKDHETEEYDNEVDDQGDGYVDKCKRSKKKRKRLLVDLSQVSD
jgi:hypothetical protein